MKGVLMVAATAALSNAFPTEDPLQNLASRAGSTSQLATFDDLQSSTVGQLIPVPYKGLNFTGVHLDTDVQPFGNHKIIIAQSEPYYVDAGSGSVPYVSIDGTKTTSFDLDSFYVGCFDGRGQTVTPCNITVTGLNAQGGRHQGPLPFTYAPKINSDFSAPMQQVTLGWNGLRAFYVDLIADAATLVRTVKVIDSVKYTTYP